MQLPNLSANRSWVSLTDKKQQQPFQTASNYWSWKRKKHLSALVMQRWTSPLFIYLFIYLNFGCESQSRSWPHDWFESSYFSRCRKKKNICQIKNNVICRDEATEVLILNSIRPLCELSLWKHVELCFQHRRNTILVDYCVTSTPSPCRLSSQRTKWLSLIAVQHLMSLQTRGLKGCNFIVRLYETTQPQHFATCNFLSELPLKK